MTAARLQRALGLVIAIALLLWNAWWLGRGSPGIALAGSLLLALPHAPVLALEMLLMRHVHVRQPVPRASLAAVAKAWWHEVGWHASWA